MRQAPERRVHQPALSFRELCDRAVPDDARYLVLDLDRTVHLGLNLGERLGWELSAYQSYGQETLDRLEATRGRDMVLLDPSQPALTARFLYRGMRRWTRPGLHYLLWGKLASTVPFIRRKAIDRYGAHFLQQAQRGTQITLLTHLDEVDPAVQRQLAERLWNRLASDQVITRQDLQALRQRHPGLTVILTSASPRAIVEVAGDKLGVDLVVYSTLASINSGRTKIERLRALCPQALDAAAVTVGITDTQYGEDHCWADHFKVVIDINGQWPFPARVALGSPVEAMHSASVLTQSELQHRAAGERDYLDPRRPPQPAHDGPNAARYDQSVPPVA